MMKYTFKRKLVISSLLVFSSLISAGCFEMNFADTQEYYDLFSDSVNLFYADESGTSSSQTTKSIESDFFNDDTVDDVHGVETISEEYYEYLCIQPTAAVTVQDMVLFVKAPETCKFEVRIYLLKSMPDTSNIWSFGLSNEDDEGESVDYGDNFSNPIHKSETATKQDNWQSIYANSWMVEGREKKYVDIGISDFIVVQFLNNTGYGVDLGYKPVKFSIVNLMVSPKNEKYAIEEK